MSRKIRKQRPSRSGTPQRAANARRSADGRVHLTLHRDPASGQNRLALTLPVFKEAWQNEVTAAAANTALGMLGSEPTLEATVELARNAMAAASRLADGLLARAPDGAVACRAGCDHCCFQFVGVTPPEALAIFDHLERTRTAAELAEVRARAAELQEKTRGLSADARFSPEYPCLFLQNGRCSIYEARPLACRGMNSLDAGECASRLRDPVARAAFLESGVGGRSFMEPIRAFHAISAGLQLSLSELYHLDMRPLELSAVMHLLFEGSPTLGQEWVSGTMPFEGALGADRTNDASIAELSGKLADAKRF